MNVSNPSSYSQTVKMEFFAWGNFSAFSSSRILPHAKIKPIYLYEENRNVIVKITPT